MADLDTSCTAMDCLGCIIKIIIIMPCIGCELAQPFSSPYMDVHHFIYQSALLARSSLKMGGKQCKFLQKTSLI